MTLVTILSVLALAGGWHALRRGLKNRGSRRKRPSRWAAVVAVALLMGFQTTVMAPSATAAACGDAPIPERPGSGLVGALDQSRSHGLAGSAYLDYSYAGMVWHVYQTDCGPLSGITSPNTTIDTWAGNQAFNIGKNLVGATNSLHYTILQGGLLDPIYGAVKAGAEKVYNNIYAQLFGLVALLLAIMMFRNIWRGDLAALSKRGLYALAAVWLAASSLAMLRYLDPLDKAIVDTTTNIQAGFIDDSSGQYPWEILPTELHTQVVYNNWLRGEFGSPDSPQAQQFGRPLLDAQAFTWNQLNNGDDANQSVVDAKKAAYKNIATQLGPATPYFTGEGGSRTGSGFLALGQSLAYALFQLLAKASVLLAQVIIRLFVLTAPLIGLIAMLHHDLLRRVARVLGGVGFNLLVLSVLAGVHALLLQAIFSPAARLSILTQMILAGLVTILLFLVGRPVRRLWQMVEMSVGMVGSSIPAPSGGLFSRFRKKQGPTPQDEFWESVREGEESEVASPTGSAGRGRPEATVFATAQRLDGAGAMAARPAAAWSGAPWPGGGPALPGHARPGLPGGGGHQPAYAGYAPEGADPDAFVYSAPPGTTRRADGWMPPVAQRPSRRVDTSPVYDRGWDEPDPVVVPSRISRPGMSATPAQRPEPRRAGQELVGGKPVHVLYRPSRGLEVRDDSRDTDRIVR
ncbi:magnesium transporter [Amycolatopsis methanolica]|uniref:magnesium transporter n=1 Tax=Amycolatopsis methanolica TaxID=1814 RepID=UPI00341B37EA